MKRLVFLVAVLLGGTGIARTQEQAEAPGHPLLLSPQSRPIVLHRAQVYVVNTPSDTLDVIDAPSGQLVARVSTGVDPVSVAVRPSEEEIWVANHISDTVSVIDIDPASATYLMVVATIQDIDLEKKATRFNEPVGIAFANASKAYVALSSSNQIAVIDAESRKVSKYFTIPAQEPRSIVVAKNRLYVIPFESNNQTQLSGGKGDAIDGDLVTFDARKLASAFDSAGFTVDVVKQPRIPDRDLFVFDTATEELVGTVASLGTNLFGLTVDGEGNAFIANTDARNHVNGRAGTKKHGLEELDNRPYLNRITKVSADGAPTFFNLNPLPPEQPSRRDAIATPFAVEISGSGKTVYVTGAGSDLLVTLDAETGRVKGRVKVGAVPRGIALQESDEVVWVLNAVDNTVSKVDVSNVAAPVVRETTALSDPTPPVYKEGRKAFNTARASSNGTFSCASCHSDGHTDHLLWVLDTPHLVGADQIEPRLSQTLRGLRGTAPYHWDGVPGDPYGGPNASTRERLAPNSDINRPESAVRHVIDGSMASTMLEEGSDHENDEGKPGYLSRAERDDMAIFLLNLSHMPTPGRAYTDELSRGALTGFERFHITGARDTKALNTNVCGSCHTFPYLATDQDSMNVPSFRGALDRFITQAQGRNSVIDLGGVYEVANKGFPEEEVWKRMLNMGEHGRLWPVIDMFKESSMGFSGAFGRQATLSEATVEDPVTRDLLRALEKAAGEGSVQLRVDGRFLGDETGRQQIDLQYIGNRYEDRKQQLRSYELGALIRYAAEGELVATFTAYHGADVTSAPPAIWTAGSLHKQRGAQLFPRVHEGRESMVISARHLQDDARLFVDGVRVEGAIAEVGRDLVSIRFSELPAKGMRMLQVQNPRSYLSNELIFFVETKQEAIERYRKEPDYLLTTILNSALINDHSEEARIVMDAGADLNMPPDKNHFDKERPPLVIASQYGRTEIVRELLSRGADPNIRTKNGDTALHRAAHLCRLEICHMLLDAGADPLARNKRDERPIDLIHHFNRKGNFEKYHAPWNVNLTLDHDRYLQEQPAVKTVLQTAASSKRPNVVILLADDLGSLDVGSEGGPVKTPAIDALAANGVRFIDFHAGAPVCSPSRATLLTGRQHLRTGVYTVIQDHVHDMHLLEREVTIAEHLKAHDYQTVHLGKWHVGSPFRGRDKPSLNDHGFDYWLATDNNAHPSHRNPSNLVRNGKRVGETEGYACQLLADEAITWLERERDPQQPFFLNIWFHEPHAPLAAPEDLVAEYGDPDDPAAVYSATIANTDRAIERVVSKLEEIGELDDTLIIYTSDHGSYRSERNGDMRGDKGSLFEGGLRTPGIFFWPKGFEGGGVQDEPAGSVDLLPTLCGLLRLPRPVGVHLDGTDLTPLLTGGGDFRRAQPLFWHSPTGQPHVALRDGDYTLVGYRAHEFEKDFERIDTILGEIREILEGEEGAEISRKDLFSRVYNTKLKDQEAERLRGEFVRLNMFQESWTSLIKAGSGGFRKFELYDLAKDPNQQEDISSQQPDVFEKMKAKLQEIHEEVLDDAPIWGSNLPSIEAGLNDLAKLFDRLESTELPDAYEPARHQVYVDKRIEGMSEAQRARLGQLWREKQRLDPGMENRGRSFIRILEYAAEQR